MLEQKEFYKMQVGRPSKYEKVKLYLLSKYQKGEQVSLFVLKKKFKISHSTARNYLYKFMQNELGIEDLPQVFYGKKIN